jgi:hypothetical protein
MYTKQEIIIRSYREGKSQRRISRELAVTYQNIVDTSKALSRVRTSLTKP